MVRPISDSWNKFTNKVSELKLTNKVSEFITKEKTNEVGNNYFNTKKHN